MLLSVILNRGADFWRDVDRDSTLPLCYDYELRALSG